MTTGFRRDLAILRGFGEEWSPEAPLPDPLSPLERHRLEPPPATADQQARLVQRLLYREAALIQAAVQAPGGAEAWTSWRRSNRPKAGQQPLPRTLGRLSRLRSSAPLLLVEELKALGVQRIHRAQFLRDLRQDHPELADRNQDRFRELDGCREALILRSLHRARWDVRMPDSTLRESLVFNSIIFAYAMEQFEVDRRHVTNYAWSKIYSLRKKASNSFRVALRDSTNMAEQRATLRRHVAELRQRAEPSNARGIAEAVGIPLRRVVDLYQRRHLGERLAAKGVGGATRLLDLRSEDPLLDERSEEELIRLWELVHAAIHGLTWRRRQIANARLGLIDGSTPSLSAIGEDFDLSRERIRQIQNDAFESIARQVATRRKESPATADRG